VYQKHIVKEREGIGYHFLGKRRRGKEKFRWKASKHY
jgi:hypothetical protein